MLIAFSLLAILDGQRNIRKSIGFTRPRSHPVLTDTYQVFSR